MSSSRDGGRVQLSVLGKGHKRREVLLPEVVSRSLLSLRGDAGANDPVFASPRDGHLTERAVNYMLKRAAANAGINPKLSAHWLRHAHANHAIDRGAALPVVQSTLGHGNIAVTSGYLHARPGDSSGLHLDKWGVSSARMTSLLNPRELPYAGWACWSAAQRRFRD
jgi:integrase/recombinase XerD